MLATVLRNVMEERKLSSHKVADAVGVSHSTILRILRGESVDLDTIMKISDFVGVRPSELLDSMQPNADLRDQLAALLGRSPELEDQLREAVERVKAGQLDPAVVKDIVSYALFKLNNS